RPGQRVRFRVATTRAPRCSRALTATAAFYAPTTPAHVTSAQQSDTAVSLSWAKSKAGDGKLAGYRVVRNGVTYRQVAATSLVVAVPAATQSTLSVASVDTRGVGRTVGYRVYRDGVLLTQVAGASYVASNLAPGKSYTFNVQAVDSRAQLSPLSAPASATTAPPVPTTGSAHAYLLATTDQSFHDLQAHYTNIGVLHPTYFQCNRQT